MSMCDVCGMENAMETDKICWNCHAPMYNKIEELKPCPFCGGTPVWQAGDMFIYCGRCGIQVDSGESLEATKGLWNNRVPDPLAEEVENMINGIDHLEESGIMLDEWGEPHYLLTNLVNSREAYRKAKKESGNEANTGV